MWSRRALAAAALATILSCPAGAQIEDSGLDQVDPWGIGYLGDEEPSLRTRMWGGARSEDLLSLMQAARTSGLTPAERLLMRRLALSGARAPGGADSGALLAQRARIAFELGEAEAAAGQLARLDVPPDGMDPAAIAADLNLALGNEATACNALSAPDLDGDYWAKLRAVCAALSGNTSGAELAMEMAQAQGVKDSWLASAIYATSGETPDPPGARFDSGLNFAMSTRAVLEITPESVPEGRPDLAAAMARRKLMPPAVRVKAAAIAAEAGLISPEEYRTAYNSALAADGFTQATALDTAVFVASDGTTTDAEKAKALAAALKAASGKPARYSAVSGLLLPDLARLPLGEETAGEALTFARASLAAGDLTEAARWITPPEPEPVPVEIVVEEPQDAPTEETEDTAAEVPADAPAEAPEEIAPPEPEPPSFDAAWIGALIVLADPEAETAASDAAARTLIEVAGPAPEKRAAARLLALWSAAGIAPPSDARAFMAGQAASAAKPQALGKALAVFASTRSGAAAETVLTALALTNGDPSKLDTDSLTLILLALEEIGADDAARQLALEATGYWKTQK